jgi:solute carrier family 13 (sodium-dependent dicarboxylate transporter), member 2/3/5
MLVLVSGLAHLLVPDAVHARATLIGGICLVLWLTELVPPFVPTLLLLLGTPLLLGRFGREYGLSSVLTWPADPVLALFIGGFALGAAAHRHGVDAAVARYIVSFSKHRQRAMVALVLGGTALMSMWMSNIAAAAMMLTALRPIISGAGGDARFRTALLLSIAVGGNLGGMATPIGSGPNAIAIAAAADHRDIDFMSWMGFGVPLVLGMLLLAYGLLLVRYRIAGEFRHEQAAPVDGRGRSSWIIAVFSLAVIAWLSEPLHGVSAPLVALAVTAVLFGTGLLAKDDLGRLDWSTLGLIAGGISLGRLIEHTGIFEQLALQVDWSQYPRSALLGALVVVAAFLSAVMSNTGTAAMLIPLAMSLAPTPSTAVIVAIATSFGMPFTISTPPNAMAYSEGGLTPTDLLAIGLPIMIVGCVVVTLTGGAVLSLFGLP